MKSVFIFIFGMLFVFFAGTLIILVLVKKPATKAPVAVSTPATVAALPQFATLSVIPHTSLVKHGQTLSLSLKLKPEISQAVTLLAGSLRLSFTYKQTPPFLPVATKVQPDQVLLGNGWAYPVNKIYTDEKKKIVYVDLALTNLSPRHIRWASEITLGEISFTAQEPNNQVALNFDPGQTKFVAEGGKEIKLNLINGDYSIY